jgi:HSP20 family protein
MTKVLRFSPRADLSRMQRDFDHMFSNFFPSAVADGDNSEPISWQPRVDVVETVEAYELSADVPGVGKEDIQINLHDGVLSISGERSSRDITEADSVVQLERHTGRFYRSFSLPNKIDSKKIDARFENGVLFVTVPKMEETKPQKIKIS